MKKPSFNEISTSRDKAFTLGLSNKECICGHGYVFHSWGLLGPCFINRRFVDDVAGSIGNVKKGECNCPRFDSDEFARDVEKMRMKGKRSDKKRS